MVSGAIPLSLNKADEKDLMITDRALLFALNGHLPVTSCEGCERYAEDSNLKCQEIPVLY